jgi:2-iminobutanoate/2-iminopropanoate deaminase
MSCLVGTTALFAHDEIIQIATTNAPQAVQAGQYLFISGQLGIDLSTGVLVGATIEEQTQQALNNIEAILQAAGLTLENVVKSEVYLKDIGDFKAMNEIYAAMFSHPVKPARQAMELAKLPRDCLVEISCIAFIP